MKKLYISVVLLFLFINLLGQKNDIQNHGVDSLEQLKYVKLISKFHSIDTLSEVEIRENQNQYFILMDLADSVCLIGNNEMAQKYYKAANQLFPKDCISSSKISPTIDCNVDELYERAMEFYDKQTESGYYLDVLELLIEMYYGFPKHQLEIRRKIINIEKMKDTE